MNPPVPEGQRLPTLLVLLMAPLAGALVTLSLAPFNLWPAQQGALK